MRAVVYTRVSTVDQAEEGLSLETQREAGERKATELGATSISVLEDAYTGISLNRPAMNKLRDLVAVKEVDLIVVYDPDRFSRDLTDLLLVTREIEQHKILLEFVNFDWQKTPQGMLFLQIRGAFAQFEHAQIKERTTRGKRKKAELGGYDHCIMPYGYTYTKEEGLNPNPETAPVVQQIFHLYLAGLSVWSIAKQLASEGVHGPRRTTWEISTIHYILRNPAYTGRVRRKNEEPNWKPLLIPPIIPQLEFDSVQEELSRRGRKRPRRHQSAEFLVQGLCFCGLCGEQLHVHSYHRVYAGKKHRYTYYRCPNRAQKSRFGDNPTRCTGPFIASGKLDQIVWLAMAEALRQPENFLKRLSVKPNLAEANARLATANASVARMEAALKRIEDAWFTDDISDARYKEAKAKFRADLEVAQREQRKQTELVRSLYESTKGEEELLELSRKYAKTVDDLPFEIQRQVILKMIERIEVIGNQVKLVPQKSRGQQMGAFAVSYEASRI